jgi:DNA-binding XRE family transcriptional regulator
LSISPAQCRAARALLSWSQADLSAQARIAKKTIADFEREARSPFESTALSLQSCLEAHGVIFIPENGGGAGVRFRLAMPCLFRWNDVPGRNWIAFAFDYKGQRIVGFADYQAMARISLSNKHPVAVFERDRQRIMMRAAEKFDAGELDAEGRVLILPGDLEPIPFDPEPDQK